MRNGIVALVIALASLNMSRIAYGHDQRLERIATAIEQGGACHAK